jgi:hypothetical protein
MRRLKKMVHPSALGSHSCRLSFRPDSPSVLSIGRCIDLFSSSSPNSRFKDIKSPLHVTKNYIIFLCHILYKKINFSKKIKMLITRYSKGDWRVFSSFACDRQSNFLIGPFVIMCPFAGSWIHVAFLSLFILVSFRSHLNCARCVH